MKPANPNTTTSTPWVGYLPLLCALLVGFGLGRFGNAPFSKADMPSAAAGKTPSVRSPPATTAAISTALTTHRLEDAGPGWHAVHVYYGDREGLLEEHKDLEKKFTEKSFSQEGQDTYALELLKNKRNGFFVDLASNHAFRLSNTFLLEQKYDWDGLCIEPNWQYWNGLASLRKCKVIGAVGGNPDAKEPIRFRFHPFKPFLGAFGGIVGDKFDNKPDNKAKDNEILEERRYTVALAEILETFGAPKIIDYFSFDVEGAEELILGQFPFDKYTFLVMNVERPSATITQLLTDNGYTKLRTDKYGDTIWKHQSLE